MFGPRIGCGFCFHTLDPEDPDESLRRFAACKECGRRYHRACWKGACVRPSCLGREWVRVLVAPPYPLSPEALVPLLVSTGPFTTLEDAPLGISRGTVLLSRVSRRARHLVIRNNSSTAVT